MLARDYSETSSEAAVESDPAPARTPLLNVVGTSARLEGKLEIADSIRIECEVGGELIVGDKLVIGPSGVVKADVQTVNAVIMGRYEGNLTATGDVEITPTGHVTGNIETDSLVIAKGGFFNGNVVKIQDRPTAAAAEKPVRPLSRLDERRLSAHR